MFEDIAWSTDQVFSQTLARAEALGLSVVQLPTWYDVDNAETLQLLVREILDGEPFRAVGIATPAAATRSYLGTLIRDADFGSASVLLCAVGRASQDEPFAHADARGTRLIFGSWLSG